MINKKAFSYMMSIMMMLGMILTSLLSFSQHVDARIMNVKDKGSLTIHKYLNPAINPKENEDAKPEDERKDAGFQGDGTIDKPLPGPGEGRPNNGIMEPLDGAEFSVYGRLTTEEVNSLMKDGSQSAPGYNPDDPKPLDTEKVKKFITEWDNDPNNKGRKKVGVTGRDGKGQVKFPISINTVDLADNMYLVVETKTPTSGPSGEPIVQQPSMPVLVNIPSTNPLQDAAGNEVNNYNYDVNLYMKNYNQTEPGIEKEIDKPIHSVGEEVKYRLTISPLAFDMNEYKELVVTDELAPELNFLQLGHNGGAEPSSIKVPNSGMPTEANLPVAIDAAESVVFYQGESKKHVLTPGTDYYVSHPAKNTNGTIRWYFTQAGIKKLTGIKAGDGSRIELYFTAVTNEKAKVNVSVPNDATLDFQNKWGYGTKPGDNPDNPNPPGPLEPGKPPFVPQPPLPGNPDPKQPTATKPTEVVNTIWGERWFEKRDKQNNAIKLNGAEFLVRNRSTRPVTALNGKGVMKTYAPGTTLYAIISDNKNVDNEEPLKNYPFNNVITNEDQDKTEVTPWIKDNQYVVGWTPDWKEAYDNHWTITSSKDKNGKDLGQFHVQGLEYTNPVHFRKMYIFAEMAIKEENGTKVEVVEKYHYVLADKRTAGTPQPVIDNEINNILSAHKGDDSGNGAWKFYKESEADVTGNKKLLICEKSGTKYITRDITPDELKNLKKPGANVDYLGEEVWNNYELIEVRAPEGYAPIEKIDESKLKPLNPNDPEKEVPDVFEHPLAFTVPGKTTDGLPNYGAPTYNDEAKENGNNVVPVPNAKLPKIPLTGGMGTIIFLIVGLVLLVTAFVVKRFKVRKA